MLYSRKHVPAVRLSQIDFDGVVIDRLIGVGRVGWLATVSAFKIAAHLNRITCRQDFVASRCAGILGSLTFRQRFGPTPAGSNLVSNAE